MVMLSCGSENGSNKEVRPTFLFLLNVLINLLVRFHSVDVNFRRM